LLNQPHEVIVIHIGENRFGGYRPHLLLEESETPAVAAGKVWQLLKDKEVILDFYL
jgi:hypothetical protein